MMPYHPPLSRLSWHGATGHPCPGEPLPAKRTLEPSKERRDYDPAALPPAYGVILACAERFGVGMRPDPLRGIDLGSLGGWLHEVYGIRPGSDSSSLSFAGLAIAEWLADYPGGLADPHGVSGVDRDRTDSTPGRPRVGLVCRSVPADCRIIRQLIDIGRSVGIGLTVGGQSLDPGRYSAGRIVPPDPDEQSHHGGCFTVVGWDDSREAFRAVNPVDPCWGDGGSGWVAYQHVLNPLLCHEIIVISDMYLISGDDNG